MREEPRWRRYLRFWGADAAGDVDDEIAFHIEERARLNEAAGVPPAEARAAAERQFGDAARIRAACVTEVAETERQARLGEMVGDVARDVRIGFRSLVRAPVYAVTAGLALALGIGATAAVFTVVSAVLLRPLPYGEPDRVVTVYNAWTGAERANLSPAEYLDYVEGTRAFSAFGVYAITTANVVEGDVAERVPAAIATASTFLALGVPAAAGRLFDAGDGAQDGQPVMVLSHEYWQSRFAGAHEIIGRAVRVNGVARTVIGVLPPGLRLPSTYNAPQPPLLYMPLRIERASDPVRGSHFLRAVARLGPGWTVASADAELKRVARELTRAYPDDYPEAMRFATYALPVHADVVGDSRRLLHILAAAVGLVLLIACANVSGLVLTRTEDRRRELAVRSALGGGSWRIKRQLLVEQLALALVAGGAGVLMAVFGVRALALLQPGDIPRLAEARVDLRVLAFTCGLSLLATLLVALVPLRFGAAAAALREAGPRTTATRASQRMRRVLIASEVALSIVLLAGAGLLLRSFANMIAVDPGYRTAQLLTVPISLPQAGYPDDAAKRRFFAQLVQDVQALPGVNAAGAVINLPLATTVGDLNIELPGHTVAEGDISPRLDWQVVTPGWFDAMGIEILRGRAITVQDGENAPGAVVLSESAARRYWPDADPLGQRFRLGAGAGPGWVTVVGIARDVRHGALTAEPPPIMYLPHAQFTFWHGGSAVATMTLVLHTAGEPMALLAPLRSLVRDMDAHVPLGTARSMEQVLGTAVAGPRFAMSVLGGFALLALALAVIGVYGLVAYTVTRRTREIAVRMALGARPHAVVRRFVTQGLQPVLIGLALGSAAAFALGRTLDSMLFGVTARDPLTLLATILTLGVIAFIAALLPARRAARVAPMLALRDD